jgi:hypothetical protein
LIFPANTPVDTTNNPIYITDQILNVNPAGVIIVVYISESVLVETSLSGRTMASTFIHIMASVARNWRMGMRRWGG